MIGPKAERAVNRLLVHSLEQRIAESDANWRTRCESAFLAGVHRGRAGVPLALVVGALIGALATAAIVALA